MLLYNITLLSQQKIESKLSFKINEFNILPHTSPICQGITGTCWAFAATSFLESEILRISKKEIKLSEMYFVYIEYTEKVKRFIDTKGKIKVNEGSEAPFVLYTLKKYGCMPFSVFPGIKNDTVYNHQTLMSHINSFLFEIKNNNIWNKEWAVSSVKDILNSEIGILPDNFTFEGKKYTPYDFSRNVLKINPADYFWFMSTPEYPYYEKHELVEDDNWLNDDNFYNVPIDTFMMLINQSLENGYTVCLCGDVTEQGYDKAKSKTATVPAYDIPEEQINDNSRSLRLNNLSTTDDHCVHIVGYKKNNGKYWYLIKDSNLSTFLKEPIGYRFYHEDYIRLKMMNIIIHKDIAKRVLDKIIK